MEFIENNILFIGVIAIVSMFGLIMLYISVRDKELARKLSFYEKSIEELNKETYKITKWAQSIDDKSLDHLDSYALKIDEIRTSLKKSLDTLYIHMGEVQNNFEIDKELLEAKIKTLEDKLKELIYLPPSVNNLDEKRILELKNAGYTPHDIAQELRISKSEVEFILKLADSNA